MLETAERRIMKKRLITLLLASTLILSGCGGTKAPATNEPVESEEAADTQEDEAPEESETDEELPEESSETEEEEVAEESISNDIVMFDFSDSDIAYANIDISDLSVRFGELLSVIQSEGSVIVVKTKIEPSLTNKMTIDQNYFNVADLVKNHGFNTCNELQYWAVADMADGSEAKCISFELDKETLDALFDDKIVENQLGDYAIDLWILPSLQN